MVAADSARTDTITTEPGARLARLDGRNILFSPFQSGVFVLNDAAAAIWQALEAGVEPVAALRRAGHAAAAAERHVGEALAEWSGLGLIRPVAPAPAPETCRVHAIHAHRLGLECGPAEAAALGEVFRHLEVPSGEPDVVFRLRERAGELHLFREEAWLLACRPEEAATLIKGELLGEVLDRGAYALAVHAAALVAEDGLLLVSGRPGAGKTTLTLALAASGFGYGGDDVTLLGADGRGVGLPFAPAVKAGAWPLLSERLPGLRGTAVHRRPDGRRVRYPAPPDPASPAPRPVARVVLLRRNAGACVRLDPVDPAEALEALLDGAFSPGGELTGDGFDALAAVLRGAEVRALVYSDLDEAVAAIGRWSA